MKQPTGTVSARSAVRMPSWAYPLVTAVALVMGVTAIVRGTRAVVVAADSDLTNFFFKSAAYILRGDPWHIYAVNVGGYPNYNPPLSIFLMAPLLWLAQHVGFAANYGEQISFVAVPFIVFVPLLGYLAVRVLHWLYPAVPETQLFLAYVLVVLSPLTWQSIATWYHVEQPLMLCLLFGAVFALQRRHAGLAGLLAGLAVLSRTTALMPLLALGVLLLVAGQRRALLQLAGIGAGVVLVAMAPFFIAYPAVTKYALLTWRSSAPIGGNTIWAIFGYTGSGSHLRYLIDAAARRLDEFAVVLFILIVAALAARRLHISAYERDAWAVMAIAALAVPMLSKTNWPYYFLEPFMLILVWEFASMHDRLAGVWRWPVLTIGFLVVAATLSQYIGLQSVGYGDRVAVGLLDSGAMFAFAWAIWARLQAKKGVATEPALGADGQPVGPAMRARARPASPAVPAAGVVLPATAAPGAWGKPAPAPPSRPLGGGLRPTNEGWLQAGAAGNSAAAMPPPPEAPRVPLWPPGPDIMQAPRSAPLGRPFVGGARINPGAQRDGRTDATTDERQWPPPAPGR